MKTVQVGTVKAGITILHPDSKIPLRVVEPKNFGVPLSDSLAVNNTVFAVDDEGGLYLFRTDEREQVPFSVPLVMEPRSGNYLIVATFEREGRNDMPTLVRNFKEGRIDVDPHTAFDLAAIQQLSLEMQHFAYDNGMPGSLQCRHVIKGKAFDRQAMGYKRA